MSNLSKIMRVVVVVMIFFGLVSWQTSARYDLPNTPGHAGIVRAAGLDGLVGSWAIREALSVENISMLSGTDGWMAHFEGKDSHLYRWGGHSWDDFGIVTHPDYEIASGDLQMVSPTDGWLVFWGDDYYDEKYYPPASILYRWDGQAWNYWQSFGGSGSGIAMSALDVLSGTDIWAVAGTMFGTKFFHWEGSAWSEITYLCCDINITKDIEMISATDGWAVGYSGMAHWDGFGWNQFSIPTSTPLRSIEMVSDTDGWAVGNEGAILHWNHGTWAEVTSPVSTTLTSIDMLSETDGWAVGEAGVILHWDGSEWSQMSSPTTADLNEIGMVSEDDGWIAGDGVVLRYQQPLPALSSNYLTGQAGSYFNFSGTNFPPNNQVALSINGYVPAATISTDSTGVFTVTISTQQADSGRYIITASINPSASTSVMIAPTEPLHPQEGDWTVIDIPSGIAFQDLYLPLIQR